MHSQKGYIWSLSVVYFPKSQYLWSNLDARYAIVFSWPDRTYYWTTCELSPRSLLYISRCSQCSVCLIIGENSCSALGGEIQKSPHVPLNQKKRVLCSLSVLLWHHLQQYWLVKGHVTALSGVKKSTMDTSFYGNKHTKICQNDWSCIKRVEGCLWTSSGTGIASWMLQLQVFLHCSRTVILPVHISNSMLQFSAMVYTQNDCSKLLLVMLR